MVDTTRRVRFKVGAIVRGYGAYVVDEVANFDLATAVYLVNRGVAVWHSSPVTRPTLEEFEAADIADLENVVVALRESR